MSKNIDKDFLESLLKKKETFNSKYFRGEEIAIALVSGQIPEDLIDAKVEELNQITADIISICVNNFVSSTRQNPFLNNKISGNQEDDILYGNLLLVLNRNISVKSINAAMAISIKNSIMTLEVNPLYLFQVLNPISDSFTKAQIEQSLETNSCEAGVFYVSQIMGILCHECLHVVYNHLVNYFFVFNLGQKYAEAMNIATDCTINQYLNNLPTNCVTIDYVEEKYKLHGLEPFQSSKYYYDAIINSDEFQEQMQQQQENEDKMQEMMKDLGEKLQDLDSLSQEDLESLREGMAQNVDSHSGWGDFEGDGESNEALNSELISQILNEAIENYESRKAQETNRGQLSSNMQEIIQKLREKTKMNWRQILQKKIGTLAVPYKLTRNRVNRRQPKRPELRGRINDRTLKLTVVIDTSGSMGKADLEYCLREIYTILQSYSFSIEIIEIDTTIRKIYEAKSDKDIQVALLGRGGTILQPVFDYFNEKRYKNREHLAVILTDGGCEPHIDFKNFTNILWILVNGRDLNVENPAGTVMYLDDDKKYKEIKES